jgi:hypothetical protein
MQKFHLKAENFSTADDLTPDAVLDANDPALTMNESPEENLIKDIKRLAGVVGNEGKLNEYSGYGSIEKSNVSINNAEATDKIKIQEENNIEPGTPEWFRLWFNQENITGEAEVIKEDLNVGFATIKIAFDYEEHKGESYHIAYPFNSPNNNLTSRQKHFDYNDVNPEDYQKIEDYVLTEISSYLYVYDNLDKFAFGSDISPEIDKKLQQVVSRKFFKGWNREIVTNKYDRDTIFFQNPY